MPWFHRARRYQAADGATRIGYFATYETDRVEALMAPEYMARLADQSDWSKKIMAGFSTFERLTCRVAIDLTHGLSGAAGLVRMCPPMERMDALRAWLRDRRLPALIERTNVIGASLIENDLEVSNLGWRAAGLDVPDDQKAEWLILVDAATAEAGRGGTEWAFGDPALEPFGLSQGDLEIGTYRLMFAKQR